MVASGLPMADSFLATSFEVIENCFRYQSLLICIQCNVFLQLFQGFV